MFWQGGHSWQGQRNLQDLQISGFAGHNRGRGPGSSGNPPRARAQLRLWRTLAAVPRAQPVVATTAMTATAAPRAMVMYQAGWAAS